MAKISVVINTLNEEENIEQAIKSVKKWAYEIVVVDMHSKDKTRELAKALGARVFTHDRVGYVEPARNFAIQKSRGDWILILDADEEVPRELARKLQAMAHEPDADYYALPRKNVIFGRWIQHSGWWPDHNVRFFKRGAVEWMPEIHSVPLTQGKGADLPAKEEFAIVHHHYKSVSQYVQRHDRYSTVMAKERHAKGEKFAWKSLVAAPTSEFVRRYFAGQGYKDGVHGLALCSLQAFVELLTFVKLWELSKFPERQLDAQEVADEIKSQQREINYWVADALVQEGRGVINRIKRKFKLP